MRNKIKKDTETGFTLIEIVAGLSIFVILVIGVMGAYTALAKSSREARKKTILATLASKQMEIIRNLPYLAVGTISGNPAGSLPDFSNPANITAEGNNFQYYYDISYEDDPADGTLLGGTDASPNDYKRVVLFLKNLNTGTEERFVTSVAPPSLEDFNSGGALRVRVINAAGQPVIGATVTIENPGVSPAVDITSSTDSTGTVLASGLPEDVLAYHIEATKSGYTTDQTYPVSVGNPNPITPDATVSLGKVTEVYLMIDILSELTIHTYDVLCNGYDNVGVRLEGEKLIGINPDVKKYVADLYSSVGQIVLSGIEWDTYIPGLITGQGYVVRGTAPIQQINVLPGASQVYTMILDDSQVTAYSLIVVTKDATTGAAIEGANVNLHKGGSTPQDYYGITSGSVWIQDDWTGGSGQATWVLTDKYYSDDGNIDINSAPTGVRLDKISGRYVASGVLESSTFDTGTSTNEYTTLEWEPTSQEPNTTLRIQMASNNDNSTWNYIGPDGTSDTYYTVSGSSINAVHNSDRYLRYKLYLDTANDKKTPILTTIIVNYVSGCKTPGQTFFGNLTQGQNYDVTVTKSGYQDFFQAGLNITGHQIFEVLMSP